MLRSRFSGNDNAFDGACGGGVTARGGAIGNGGTLSVYRSSFTGNPAIRGGGGAIINQTSESKGPGRLHLAFSTLTDNEANVPCRTVSGEPLAGCALAQPGDAFLRDKWGTPDVPLDAELGPLVGFPAQAHSLDATSPAVDFGGSSPLAFVFLSCPDSDQLHAVRPAEGAGVCDAGARERPQ